MSDSQTHAIVQSLIAHALELRDLGHADWLERATQDCPEHAARVALAVENTDRMADLFGDAPEGSMVGLTLEGRFKIGRRIGAGAMGVVHLAEDLKLIRPVAVKILRGTVVDKERAVRRFLREAEATASVQHQAVVTIHDQGQTEAGEPYLVMELVEGAPLSAIVESAAARVEGGQAVDAAWLGEAFGLELPADTSWVRLVATWTAELAGGVAAVHTAGVLHRDIKPSNVIVRRDGRPVLLDFGLALLDADSTLTRGQTSVGTPVYMPPEALVQNVSRSPASDVYSLCATLYHLLTLEQPYSGTPTEVLAALATREPAPIGKLRPDLPRDLRAIVEMGMERRPSARYASATTLQADLEAFLDLRAVSARPISPLLRAYRRARRSKVLIGAVAALLLVAVFVGATGFKDWRAAKLAARDFAIRAELPPALNVVGPTNRVFRYESDRDHVRALLDEGVALGVSPVVMPLLRACFRLDHGDPAGAASDMRRVARAADTPYAEALAARYAELPQTADVFTVIGTEGLPAPETAEDHFLAGYHALRASDIRTARTELAMPGVEAVPFGLELRTAIVDYGAPDSVERFNAAVASYNALLDHETRQGGRTSSSRNQIAYALGMLQRYREAYAIAEDAVELSPRAYTVRINAGFIAMRLGLHAPAQAHLEVAMDMRPNYLKPLYGYVWELIGVRAFDRARTAISTAELDPTPGNVATLLNLAHAVEVQHALDLYRAGRNSALVGALERADQARAALPETSQNGSVAIHDGLAAGDEQLLFRGLAELYLADPTNSWLLTTLAENVPAELTPSSAAIVKLLLSSFPPLQLRLGE